MFTQRRANLCKAFLAAVVVQLLLATAGQCAVLTEEPQTTNTTAPSSVSRTTQPYNSSVEPPVVLKLHKPCGSEHENYCENGGVCMYPQDSEEPSCICTPPYNGNRCLFSLFVEDPHRPQVEKIIGILFLVFMLLMALAIVIYCYAQKRCMKSAPLIKSASPETSV